MGAVTNQHTLDCGAAHLVVAIFGTKSPRIAAKITCNYFTIDTIIALIYNRDPT